MMPHSGGLPPFDPDKDPLFKSQRTGAPSNRMLAIMGLGFLGLGILAVAVSMPGQPTTASAVCAAILGASLLILFILCLRIVFAPAREHERTQNPPDEPSAE